jgi:hypothetical protein
MKTVIEMAREAGFDVKMFKPPVITAQHSNGSWVSVGEELKAFADLIRADERGAILEISQSQWFKTQAEYDAAIRARGVTPAPLPSKEYEHG